MNILFVAPPSEFTQSIKRAFERKGANVLYINERTNYLVPGRWRENKKLWTNTIRKFSFLKTINKKFFNRRLMKLADTFRPDLLLTTKGSTIRKPTLDAFRARGITTVNWWMENPYYYRYWSWVQNNYANFQYFLVVGSAALRDLPSTDRCTVRYLPPAIDVETYRNITITDEDRKRYECDVSFVGARYPEREELLSAIVSKGYNLKIFGWHDWKSSSLSQYWHGPLTPAEFAQAYRVAAISLNSNLFPAKGSVNLKTFEILASGGFQLCDEHEDIMTLFKEGKELAIYRSTEDLLSKIDYYLNHAEERQQIAKAGYEKVMQEHTIDARVADILKLIA